MSDIRRQGEPSNMEDTIPFTFVTWGMYIKLANKLDPDSSVNGNNWRMLAEKLGYSTQAIMVFEAQNVHQGRNTLKLLSDYSQRHGSTVNALYEALDLIERPDALGELEDGLPDIKKSYHDSKKHCRGPLDETEFHCYSCGNKPSFDSFHQTPSHHQAMMSSISKCPPHSKMNGQPHGISGHVVSHSGHMRPSLHGGPAFSDNRKFQRHISVDSACTAHSRPTQYEQLSPELKRQKSVNDSMAVRGHDNHSQYFPSQIEPMDYSPAVREDPVPPAMGILRGIQRFDRQAGPTNFMNSYMAPGQEREGLFRHPLPPGAGHGERGMHLKLKIPQPGEPKSYRPNHMEMGEDFSSPSPTPSTPSTPLDRLTQLTHDKKFQPDEAYTDLMRMKQEEESLQGRAYPAHHEASDSDRYPRHSDLQPGHAAPPITARQNCEKTAALMCKPKSATLEKEPPNTFPLRVKSNFCLSSSNSTSGSQILMKSASVPSNLKPAEFRIAFRDIKVFVTYSDDDKRHTQRVLSLCKCLGKNGFTCCVDIYPRKLPLEDRNSWYQKRFEEADFILMVVSPKYKNEVDMCEDDNDADDSDSMDSDDDGADRGTRPHQLHTKQIYRLMVREYTQAGGRCTRFVPVLFQGLQEQLIPDWIYKAYNRVYYMWPEQYKDLLWMLTKPEARIPQAQVALPDRGSSHEASDSSELNTESD